MKRSIVAWVFAVGYAVMAFMVEGNAVAEAGIYVQSTICVAAALILGHLEEHHR